MYTYVRTYVPACEAGRRAVPNPAGRGRAHGRKEEAAILERRVAITRHPVGARGFFLPGRGGARLVAVRTGRSAGAGTGPRERAGRSPPSNRASRPAGRRGSAEARRRRGPAIGAGGGGSGGAAGPELGAGRRRRSPAARAARPRAGAAPLFASGGCRCGAAASGGPRRSVPRRESRRNAARVRSTRWAPCVSRWRGRFARGPPARLRGDRGAGWGWGRPEGKVVVRGPDSVGPPVKWWRFLASGAVIRCVWRGVVFCFGLRPFKA